jgi:hypothetical protein
LKLVRQRSVSRDGVAQKDNYLKNRSKSKDEFARVGGESASERSFWANLLGISRKSHPNAFFDAGSRLDPEALPRRARRQARLEGESGCISPQPPSSLFKHVEKPR